jgi:adenylylsulfate kinase-like enzyme
MPIDATQDPAAIPVLVLTGPVGVGKTTVAQAISDLLSERGLSHAVIDQDWLRWCLPSPPHDPFQIALGLKNLAAVCANYRAAGAERLIIADVVETQADRESYRAAVPGATLTIVRLRAALPTLHARLARRDAGASLEWHRHRAAELALLMERNAIGDLTIDTEGNSASDVAREITRYLRWDAS